jgi:hypothetical protein
MNRRTNSGGEKQPGMRENLDQIHERNKRLQEGREAGDPKVGIFWDVNGKVILAGVELSEAEDYGQFKNYPGSHEREWRVYQRISAVPRETEYDEPPRGRVVYDTVSERLYLYADPCILQVEAMLNQIRSDLRLPPEVKIGPDEHYRCAKCLSQVVE